MINQEKSTFQKINDLTYSELNSWSTLHSGFASKEVSEILSKSRLDRMISLTECLDIWVNKNQLTDGELILANTNIGSLVESWLKLFYCIYLEDAEKDQNYIFLKGKNKKENLVIYQDMIKLLSDKKLTLDEQIHLKKEMMMFKSNTMVQPNDLSFEQLKQFSKNVFDEHVYRWIASIQYKRNCIHSFNENEIGTTEEFFINIGKFYDFIDEITSRFPPIEDFSSYYNY